MLVFRARDGFAHARVCTCARARHTHTSVLGMYKLGECYTTRPQPCNTLGVLSSGCSWAARPREAAILRHRIGAAFYLDAWWRSSRRWQDWSGLTLFEISLQRAPCLVYSEPGKGKTAPEPEFALDQHQVLVRDGGVGGREGGKF